MALSTTGPEAAAEPGPDPAGGAGPAAEPGLEAGDPPGLWPAWARRASEPALLALVAALQLGGTALAATHQPESIGVAGAALLGVGVAAVPARRRWPVAALWASFLATLLYWSLDTPRGPVFASLVVTLANAVLTGHRRAVVATAAVGWVAFPWLGPALGNAERPPLASLLVLAAWLLALVSACEAVRARRERVAEARRRQLEALRRRATDERLRIARELHDVVAHNMSLINVQAGVALHLLGDEPNPTRESLAVIREASRDALVELRSILGVLRQVDEGAPRSPTPGLAQLDELVARSEAAGVRVRLDTARGGHLDQLPRDVSLAAYRIIQESLTNVARHARPPEATVRIEASDGALTVEVLDEGSPAPLGERLPSGGNGLAGMAERAAAVGGEVEAGRRPGRGFRVRARLPLAARP